MPLPRFLSALQSAAACGMIGENMRGDTKMKEKVLLLGANGLVGRAVAAALREDYQIIPAAGHGTPEGGCYLPVEEPGRLTEVLELEAPEIVISSIRGDFGQQMAFHEALAERLGERLSVFRLPSVWSEDCPRLRMLERHSRSGEPHHTWRGDTVNVALARQVGDWARYVLGHGLRGIFHVGTTDMVDYFVFEKMVCEALGIPEPVFEIEEAGGEAYQAVLPGREDIPEELQMTVAQVLESLRDGRR